MGRVAPVDRNDGDRPAPTLGQPPYRDMAPLVLTPAKGMSGCAKAAIIIVVVPLVTLAALLIFILGACGFFR